MIGMTPLNFDALVDEANSVSVNGWNFSWLNGRAVEDRPTWRYVHLLAQRLQDAHCSLDLDTGGGEVLAEALASAESKPAQIQATESWPPNVKLARQSLHPYGGTVIESATDGSLPFDSESFDLVTSRHPIKTQWIEIARVLQRNGAYLAQHVGAGSNRELTDFFLGPQQIGTARSPERAVREAVEAGLTIIDLRHESLRASFFDVGAVVYFLRKVVWTVPEFSVELYIDKLRDLHQWIEMHGSFDTTIERFLVQAVKP